MIKEPIIISEPGDVMVFDSVDKALSEIEQPDVFDNVYIAYDSEGRLLRLIAQDRSYRYPIIVETTEEIPTHQNELRNLLLSFLKRVSKRFGISEEWLSQATLGELIEKCKDPRQ